MFCPNCGTNVPDQETQCPTCGQLLASNQYIDQMSKQQPNESDQFANQETQSEYNNPYYNQMPPQMSPVMPNNSQKKANAFALTGMILGILAAVTGICCLVYFSAPLGLAGMIFSIIAIVKKQNLGMSITGLVLSIVFMIYSIIMLVMVVNMMNSPEFMNIYQDMMNQFY